MQIVRRGLGQPQGLQKDVIMPDADQSLMLPTQRFTQCRKTGRANGFACLRVQSAHIGRRPFDK
jgi:hypothetical protein